MEHLHFKRRVNPELILAIPSNESNKYKKLRSTQYTDEESFDCPVCYSMILPPIRTVCKNLHIVCSSCVTHLQDPVCPKCRLPMQNYPRSYELEHILKSLLIKTNLKSCFYADYGCRMVKDIRNMDQLISHEDTCKYRWVKLSSQLNRLYDEIYVRLQNKRLWKAVM